MEPGKVRKHISEDHQTEETAKDNTSEEVKTNTNDPEIMKLKQLLEELSAEMKETTKSLKKSEARCETLVTQVEDLTIVKTKAVAETTRMTTLADSLQVLLDSKKVEVENEEEQLPEKENNKKHKSIKRKSNSKYWNKGYCSKGTQCSWKTVKNTYKKENVTTCIVTRDTGESAGTGHKEYQHNVSKVNVSNKENCIRPPGKEYEQTSHIDVSLKEEIRNAVIKILKEMTEQR